MSTYIRAKAVIESTGRTEYVRRQHLKHDVQETQVRVSVGARGRAGIAMYLGAAKKKGVREKEDLSDTVFLKHRRQST